MIKLEVKNADGSTYWVEHFNSMPEAKRWADIEQNRPYWVPGRTFEYFDMTPPPKTKEEIDRETEKVSKVSQAILDLKSVDIDSLRSVEDLRGLIKKILIALNVRD